MNNNKLFDASSLRSSTIEEDRLKTKLKKVAC